jgi:hypothetical protein
MIENFGYNSTIGLTLIKKANVAKHLQGRHNQKTHAGGMSNVWAKGQWHQMSDKDYVSFISDSHRLAQGKSERREISKTEWNKDYAKTNEEYLEDKPTRVYKNGNIVVFSKQSEAKYHTSIHEGSFMRDVDDLQEKYPVDQLVIRIGDDIDTVSNKESWGATVRGGQGGSMMWIRGDSLSPNQMRQGPHSMEAQYKAGLRTYILTHEWAHAIDKPDSPMNFDVNDAKINELVNSSYGSAKGTALMSTYGNSDPSEAFAEAFTDYVIGQDRGEPSRNPLVNKMAETFGWDKPWKK